MNHPVFVDRGEDILQAWTSRYLNKGDWSLSAKKKNKPLPDGDPKENFILTIKIEDLSKNERTYLKTYLSEPKEHELETLVNK